MRLSFAAFALVAALVGPASAQMARGPQPACPASPAPLPRQLAGWSAATPLKAARATREVALATLTLCHAAKATLAPIGALVYPFAPEHAPAANQFGGLFGFTVAEGGSYRVALGGGAWIDVVKDAIAVRSSAHGHGPYCTGVRKIVDFPLQPGRYILQVSGATTPALTLMVTRLPA